MIEFLTWSATYLQALLVWPMICLPVMGLSILTIGALDGCLGCGQPVTTKARDTTVLEALFEGGGET